jgi:glucose/mannose-6-phosphate isomerase
MNLKALFLESDLYDDNYRNRIKLTQEVLSKNNVESIFFIPSGNDVLTQVLESISFGGYVTLYLALLYSQDPSVIPWVDYFKNELSKLNH